MRHDFSMLQRAFARFAAIPAAEWTRLQRIARIRTWAKGGFVLRQDDKADWLGFLEAGLLRVFHCDGEREVNLWFEPEGAYVGAYEAYVQGTAARFSLQALEPCRVVCFLRHDLDALMPGHPCWRELAWRVAESELARKIERDVEARTRSPEQRYADLLRSDSYLVRRVPLYHLASYLGIAPETLSRIRARMDDRPRRAGVRS